METIEHDVIVDDNISVKLKIPKVMTAIELKALSMKADKLFKLSDVNIPRSYKKRTTATNENGKRAMFTEEMGREIYEWRSKNHMSYEQIAVRLNKKYNADYTKMNVQYRYYNEKERIRLGKNV